MTGEADKTELPVNAVVVTRTLEDGKVSVTVGTTGDVLPTEIGDVLAYALALHRRSLGLD